MEVSVVCSLGGNVLEGPHWDHENNVLYFVDIKKACVYMWDPSKKTRTEWKLPDEVGAVVKTDKGRLLVAMKYSFHYLDVKAGRLEKLTEIAERDIDRFNDGKCDPHGRFYAGTMGVETLVDGQIKVLNNSKLYCLQGGSLGVQATDICISNGLAWSQDEKLLYYIDSLAHSVDVFDYDKETGNLANRRKAFAIPKEDGYPDGMTIDAEGMLWVALFSGSKVVRYNPTTGAKLREVKLPTSQVTSCCFGGPNLDELYVTTAQHFLSPQQMQEQPEAGSLFKVTGLGVKGTKSNVYKE